MQRLVVACVILGGLVSASALRAATVPGFRSPTGNISCTAVARPATLFCSIATSSYAQRLQAHCMHPGNAGAGEGVDWHGFELGAAGKGLVTCSGGALVMGTIVWRTVPYGSTWRQGPFRCSSARAGVTCTNRRAHGVFVSRAAWRIW